MRGRALPSRGALDAPGCAVSELDARAMYAFHMGQAAGVCIRVKLDRLAALLLPMGRTPTEFYEMPPAEAEYMRLALELIVQRLLPFEVGRCAVPADDARELREAIDKAIEQAWLIERSGDAPGTIPLRKRPEAP